MAGIEYGFRRVGAVGSVEDETVHVSVLSPRRVRPACSYRDGPYEFAVAFTRPSRMWHDRKASRLEGWAEAGCGVWRMEGTSAVSFPE